MCVRAQLACGCPRVGFLLAQGLPLVPGRALPFVKGRKEAKAFQRAPLESVFGERSLTAETKAARKALH
ncbi:hypothetical protein HMPREF1141_1297 [Clostridium sp. MSTE9]|nr:hypothetical protein HMPREF1141_1297 [Clostridium sp. MSTE9]